VTFSDLAKLATTSRVVHLPATAELLVLEVMQENETVLFNLL